jgi:hypothetical protein
MQADIIVDNNEKPGTAKSDYHPSAMLPGEIRAA